MSSLKKPNMEQHPHMPAEADAGYETSDVSPRGIILLGAVLAAVTVLASLLLYLLFGRLEQRAERADRPISPLADSHEPAHGPLLETNFSYVEGRKKDQNYLD